MRSLDLAVILAYLAGITWFGARFRSGQRRLRDYFLGGRTAPWWAISPLHRLGRNQHAHHRRHPGPGFHRQPGVSADRASDICWPASSISVLFLPQYFRGEMFTAYELMRRRFGERIRKLTASIFPGHARAGRRGAGVRHLAGDLDRAGHRRDRVHRADRCAHAFLHISKAA